MAAIEANQVVIVAGETGSGKTTQLPKMCLELGRGRQARIGHTQPRRIAARSVAARIAEELGGVLGDTVGYAVRFTDQVGPSTAIKVMTDGILLAEIQHDRLLRQYDTIIVDEAHERSLTIDFLLGYLKALLPRRPDLKVIITSATIDPQRFAAHFDSAPIIEVSGRTYPVEIRYRPLVDAANDDDGPGAESAPASGRDGPRDQIDGIVEAVAELGAAGPGDILVFLSGEREIRDTADVLRGLEMAGTEILPLYARLTSAEQHRIFAPHSGRRIILSTNIAETSLTVPGIRYVIDAGYARIVRYSARTKVQRLPIEAISQASAQQRAGRCGRLSDGICIRLYSESDFESRPAFTDPEILRTSLAAVILQMASLDLGDIAAFGFLDPPDRRAIRDGVAILHELGALDPGEPEPAKALTAVGRRMARLPVDPRLARMLLAAETLGALSEVIVVAAALSIQDPRERPADSEQAADQAHARFRDDTSDFTTLLNLSRYLAERQTELSGNQFRRMCRTEYLHYLRIREWQDLVAQLRRIARTMGLGVNRAPAAAAAIHEALLSGLVAQVGVREGDRRDFTGTRNTRFTIASGSGLARKPPRWVMAAELVETNRLYARTVARTDPALIERAADHLVLRTYSDPRWDERRGAAVAAERVTLYGLTLAAGRTVAYARVDPVLARELFIRHALVEGQWSAHHHFLAANRAVLADIAEAEQRLRRRDLQPDEDTLFDFYDARVPAEAVSTRHFEAWWKRARRTEPDRLSLTIADVTAADTSRAAALAAAGALPDEWQHDGVRLPLTYRFDPGALDDGVTVHIPVAVVNRLDPAALPQTGSAQRVELIAELLRSLPKSLRRELGPAPDRARALHAALDTGDQAAGPGNPLLYALEREIRATTGVSVAREDWDLEQVPAYLRPRFVVEDDSGVAVASGRDLATLRTEVAAPVQAALRSSLADIERIGLTQWSFGDLPESVQRTVDGVSVTGFPGLVDDGPSVSVRVLADERSRRAAMRTGTMRLLRLSLGSPAKAVVAQFDANDRLRLGANPDGSLTQLADDCLDAVVLGRVDAARPVFTEAGFAQLRESVRPHLAGGLQQTLRSVLPVLDALRDTDAALAQLPDSVPEARADLLAQRAVLIGTKFVSAAGPARLSDLERYLRAMTARMQRLPRERDVDLIRLQRVEAVTAELRLVHSRVAPDAEPPAEFAAVATMIQELRVSLFAQQLRTPYPVSEQRIRRALEAIVV